MTQSHCQQEGTFHITTNAKGKIPWCTAPGVPEILIDNLIMTRNMSGAKVYAFCILLNHVHIVVSPGEKGLSKFMQSFKCQSARDINLLHASKQSVIRSGDPRVSAPENEATIQWQKGFFDEIIQDSEQRSNALTYVQYNAWRHGLTDEPDGWPWSSLRFQQWIDPTEIWLH
jgi:REP element-mobilizing transposase RayT